MNTNNTVRPVDSLNIVTVVTDETQVNVTRPVTNVVRVVGPGPIGPQGIQGIQGETGLTVTDLFVYLGDNVWSSTASLQLSASLIVSQSVTGLSGFTGSLRGTADTASYFAGYGNSTVLINQHATYNIFTGSIQTQVDGLSNATSSYVLNSVTSSMLQPYVLTSVTQSMLRPYVLTSVTSSMLQPYVLTSVTQSMLQPYVLTSVTGSMLQPYVLTSTTSSMIVSGALTASYYLETDPIFVAKSGSLATTGSNRFVGNQIITGSVYLKSGSVIDSIGADIYIKAGVGNNAGVALYNNNSTQYLAVDDTGSYANKFTVADKLTVSGLTTTRNQQITGSLSQGIEGNIATGEGSHAEGSITKAIGNYSHAEGDNTQAIGNYSHAEGQETITLASAQYSHAEGYRTIASAKWQHVQGQWNATSSVESAFIVGNGTDNNNRSNLIHAAGNEVQISGSMIFGTGGITGSLRGTAATASFVTSSNVQGPHGMNSVVSASYAITASYYQETDPIFVAKSASLATTGSNTFIGNQIISGSIYLGSGSIISESGSTLILTPPTALPGQSLVLRPTQTWSLTSDHPSGFAPGDLITITFTPNIGGGYTFTASYAFTDCTEVQLGRPLTGSLDYVLEESKSLAWTIPSVSNITSFTFTIDNVAFPESPDPFITLTRTGSTNNEPSHLHLISGNPTTVDLYLGDDDQYVKIEKNAGNVVIGTNLDTNRWIFDTSSLLTAPGRIDAPSFSGSFTGSLRGTAATASFVTSSNVQGPHGMNSVVSASYAMTASYVNVLTQDVTISGSLFTTGSNTLIGNTYLTGSLNVSGSTVQTGNNTLIGNTVLSGSIAISGSSTITGVTVMSGSLRISGSTTQTGNNSLIGNTTLSGSIIISGAFGTTEPTIKIYGDTTHDGYLRFNPVSTNIDTSISASYIYVSGSTQDLYFSQNGKGYSNVTRLRWLEGNLYTGLLHGGVISQVNSNTYQISSGSGIIVNLNASYADDPYPTIQYLQWPNLTKTIDPLSASFDQQFVSIDSTNNIFAQGTPYTDGQYNTLIPIGIVLHQNHISINAVQTFPSVAYGWKQRSYDFIKAFGPLKISGYNLTQSGSSVGGLLLSGGTAWVDGRNYTIDPNNTAYIVEGTGIATSKIFRYYQSGSNWQNEWGYDTNAGAGYTAIDPAQYSNAGTLTALTNNNKWSIQRVFYFPNSATKALYVYYGNAQYDTKTDAIAAIATEAFNEAPNTTANAIFIGYMILQKIANFNTPATYEFKAAGLFRAGGAGGAGGGGVTALSNLTDVSVSTSVYGDLLMKGAGAWVNSKQLSGSYGITGSLNVTGSSAIVGSSVISGSLNVTGSLYANFAYLTGSLLGTAATASFVTSSNVQGPYGMNSIVSASHAVTVRSYAQLIGDGATNNITVTHGLGTNDLHITVYSASGNFENIIPDIHRTDTNTIQVRFVNPPGLNQYRVYISV